MHGIIFKPVLLAAALGLIASCDEIVPPEPEQPAPVVVQPLKKQPVAPAPVKKKPVIVFDDDNRGGGGGGGGWD